MKMARIQKQEKDGTWVDIDMMKLVPGDVFRKIPPDEDPTAETDDIVSVWICDEPPVMTPDGPSCSCHERVAVRCPWCQRTSVKIATAVIGETTSYAVECGECGARGPLASTPAEANYLWGERQRTMIQLQKLMKDCIAAMRDEAQEIADFTNSLGMRLTALVQPKISVREMLKQFNAFATAGPVEVAINCKYPGVEVPDVAVLDPHSGLTKLNFSPRYLGRELTADENGLQQVLSFKGEEHPCKIPWRAIIAMRPFQPISDASEKPKLEVVPK